jgi:hypothetical protein
MADTAGDRFGHDGQVALNRAEFPFENDAPQ